MGGTRALDGGGPSAAPGPAGRVEGGEDAQQQQVKTS